MKFDIFRVIFILTYLLIFLYIEPLRKDVLTTIYSSSFRPRHDGVQRFGVRLVLRDPTDLALLPDPPGSQPCSPDDLHLYADVLYLHELQGKTIRIQNQWPIQGLIFNSLDFSQLNIHRFKVVARFGLMHVVATNLCVWVRTLVFETLKDITAWSTKSRKNEDGIIGTIRKDLTFFFF